MSLIIEIFQEEEGDQCNRGCKGQVDRVVVFHNLHPKNDDFAHHQQTKHPSKQEKVEVDVTCHLYYIRLRQASVDYKNVSPYISKLHFACTLKLDSEISFILLSKNQIEN